MRLYRLEQDHRKTRQVAAKQVEGKTQPAREKQKKKQILNKNPTRVQTQGNRVWTGVPDSH
jgi:hypothetical protein